MDKRSEPRITSAIRFFVHVKECPQNPDLAGLAIRCDAIDFSTHGAQFRAQVVIPAGALLNITIGIEQPFGMFLLLGEVRWVRKAGAAMYAGVLLHADPDTDYAEWGARFNELFS